MATEIWKTIEGFEDYQISNLGRIKSFKYGKQTILRLSLDRYGYVKVGLFAFGKRNMK